MAESAQPDHEAFISVRTSWPKMFIIAVTERD